VGVITQERVVGAEYIKNVQDDVSMSPSLPLVSGQVSSTVALTGAG
jgi:hypothetical protein